MPAIYIQKHFFAAALIFLFCFLIGIGLARQRALWNDEIYSQTFSVQKTSYAAILKGHVPEGNNCPLFYIIQKILTDITHAQTSFDTPNINDSNRIILRLPANFLMSLAIALFFFFFATRASWLAGFLALGTTLSSFMIWAYWAEARPYALWLCLTTLQSLILIDTIRTSRHQTHWPYLLGTHALLSLTSVLAFWQISLAALLFAASDTAKNKKHLGLLLLPVAVCFFYALTAPQYNFIFPPFARIAEILLYNIPPERLVFLLAAVVWIRLIAHATPRNHDTTAPHNSRAYILFAIGILTATAITLTGIKIKNMDVTKGFDLTFRYFIYLTPVGILLQSLFLSDLFSACRKHRWLTINLLILAATIMLLRFLDTYTAVSGWYEFF